MSEASVEVTLAAREARRALNLLLDLIADVAELYPGQKKKLESHCAEIHKAQRVVELICSQRVLRTSGVVAGIRKLQSHGDNLKKDLVSLGAGRDEHDVAKVMGMLGSERKRLVQQIQVAGVGLNKDAEGYSIDTKVVASTNEAAKKMLGESLGLEISLFVAKLKRAPDQNGKIRLSAKEFNEWTWHQTKICHPEIKTVSSELRTRIVCNCLARGQSIQILGPIGEDLWAGIALVKTENLVSMDQAIQLGYAQTMEVFREVLDRQDVRIASSKVKEVGV